MLSSLILDNILTKMNKRNVYYTDRCTIYTIILPFQRRIHRQSAEQLHALVSGHESTGTPSLVHFTPPPAPVREKEYCRVALSTNPDRLHASFHLNCRLDRKYRNASHGVASDNPTENIYLVLYISKTHIDAGAYSRHVDYSISCGERQPNSLLWCS